MGPGTTAYLDGPHGNLTLKGRSGKGIALIAGGVGVAPLLSIARQLDNESDPRPLILLYGNRLADQIVYEDELKLLAGKNNRDVRLVLSEPEPGWTGLRGMIDRPRLMKCSALKTLRSGFIWYVVRLPCSMLSRMFSWRAVCPRARSCLSGFTMTREPEV